MIQKLLLSILIASLCGCSLFTPAPEMHKSAEELAMEGSSAFLAKDYKDALKAYTRLKDWYPFSRYAILAELKIADSHFHLEQYDEAILAYEDFEKMHPRNEAVPYVIYQTGLCWFNQLRTLDRDHTPARKSLAQFNRLVDQFPQSEYAQKAREYIDLCIASLAGHELYIADFYMKTGKYQAALERYKGIVEVYPDSEQSREALARIPECSKKAEKEKK